MSKAQFNVRAASRRGDDTRRAKPGRRSSLLGATTLAGSMALSLAPNAHALPAGGTVSAGSVTFAGAPGALRINQSSQNAAINWQSFNIRSGESVVFAQPNSTSVALNRVTGGNPAVIMGSLTANGRLFLIDPSGVLFARGAQVNVGGLVASTLNISDANFMAGRYNFAGTGGSVLNQGSIHADGGYVALLGASVGNNGVISARLGTVVLAAGAAVTLDVAGDGLLTVAIDKGAVNALVQNGGLITANGGQVVLTAQAAGQLLKTVVNNTGVVEARTLESHEGSIVLLGDMQSGAVNVGGVLDASAPVGGNGGFIETSASNVNVANDAKITTAAPMGLTGTWRIDPQDFTIAAGGNISGATLSAMLVTNSVVISTMTGPDVTTAGTPPVTSLHTATPGNGDINVNEAVSWTATPSTTTLTLNALRDVNVNKAVTATNGNFVVCCGRDANVNAAVTTVNGSILVSAGRDVFVNTASAITTTDGNITICAGRNVDIAAAMTLTRGTTIPAQSLGLATGMVLIAGFAGNGPGVAAGTVIFAPLAPPVTVTGPNADVTINYNPVSYATPTAYLPHFTLTGGATLAEHMLVFPNGDKAFDGGPATTLSGFRSTPATGALTGVTLVAGPGATAVFDTAGAGTGIGITYSGYSLGGVNAGAYALAVSCCTPVFRTSGTITAA